MTIPEFCIKRPVFTTVLNVMIIVVGIISYLDLPVREYPEVSIPKLTVSARYPNASAELVESEVTYVLEDILAAVEGLDHIKSRSTNGQSRVSLSFKEGTSMDRAMILVQNSLATVSGVLPKDVREVTVEQKGSGDEAFFYISLQSGYHSVAELTHISKRFIVNSLKSIPGVASVREMGAPYRMEILLDPLRMRANDIVVSEVLKALEDYDKSFPSGKDEDDIPIILSNDFETVEDFEDLVISRRGNGVVMLSDVADIKLSSEDYMRVRYNGKPAMMMGVMKSSEGNPLLIGDEIREMLPQIQAQLPDGVIMAAEYDKSKFIKASLKNVKSSIFEAVFCVILIIFFFLRSYRATIIPLMTIPVSLIGAFSLMSALGYSINTITLLAMVLAIGLVVDDAIVVLENIHRYIEEGMKPLQAAIKGSREIVFAVIAMTLTLASVYAPIMFVGGVTGQLFIEFALTLVAAVLVSGICALTLSPLMCSRVLKAHKKGEKQPLEFIEKWLQGLQSGYRKILPVIFARSKMVVAGCIAVVVMSGALIMVIPSELSPPEDRGIVGIYYPPMPGVSRDTMEDYVKYGQDLVQKIPELQTMLMFIGDWGGQSVAILDEWGDRSRSADEIKNALMGEAMMIPTAEAYAWSWDSNLPGIGESSGPKDLEMVVRTTGSYEELFETLEQVKNSLRDSGHFEDVYSDLLLNFPSYNVDIKEKQVAVLDIKREDIAKGLEVFYGGKRPMRFQKDAIRYDVFMKAKEDPNHFAEVYVKSQKDKHQVSLATLANIEPSTQPNNLQHFNQMRSAALGISLKEGMKIEQAIELAQPIVEAALPDNMLYEYKGIAKQYKESANKLVFIFGLALVFIFAILAVQFESFLDPLLIMVTVPLACGGGLLLLWLVGGSLNIFSQIGLVTLVGLITKHGILMVEFANQKLREGMDASKAMLEAASLRLRPILMTTGAMSVGCLPLLLASGAGHEARASMGAVIFGGLILGTILTLFVMPSIYTV
ncbi:MAG: efflux RND transporter permease subunit, partial [Alphaproteobacteria bacterium]